MSEQARRKPDWTLCVKEGEKWRAIGAAWNTDRGNMFVRFDEPVAAGVGVMAFPYREPRPPSRYASRTWRRPDPPRPAPIVRTTPLNQDDDECHDPEAPEWLDK